MRKELVSYLYPFLEIKKKIFLPFYKYPDTFGSSFKTTTEMAVFMEKSNDDNNPPLSTRINAIILHLCKGIKILADPAIADGEIQIEKIAVNFSIMALPFVKLFADNLWYDNPSILAIHKEFSQYFEKRLEDLALDETKKIDTEEFISKVARVVIEWLSDPRIAIYQKVYSDSARLMNPPKIEGNKYPKNNETFYVDVCEILRRKLTELCECEHGSREQWLANFNLDDEVNHLMETYGKDTKTRIRDICSSLISYSKFETSAEWWKFVNNLQKWIELALVEEEQNPAHILLGEVKTSSSAVMRDIDTEFGSKFKGYFGYPDIRAVIKFSLDMIRNIETYSCPEAEQFWLFWESQLSSLETELETKVGKPEEGEKLLKDYIGILFDRFKKCGQHLMHMDLEFLVEKKYDDFFSTVMSQKEEEETLKRKKVECEDHPSKFFRAGFHYMNQLVGLNTTSDLSDTEPIIADWLHSVIGSMKPEDVEKCYGAMGNPRLVEKTHKEFLAKHKDDIDTFYNRHFGGVAEEGVAFIDWASFIDDFIKYMLTVVRCLDKSDQFNLWQWEFWRNQLMHISEDIGYQTRHEYLRISLGFDILNYIRYFVNNRERTSFVPKRVKREEN